jgi:hypothetical protein
MKQKRMDSLILPLYKLKKRSLQKNKNKRFKKKNLFKDIKKMFLKEYFLTVLELYGHLLLQLLWLQ